MSSLIIQSGTLEDIADAIRAKTGGQSAMTPAEMITAIGTISGGSTSNITFTGNDLSYFLSSYYTALLRNAGEQASSNLASIMTTIFSHLNITTSDINNLCFSGYSGATIPFTINLLANSAYNTRYLFNNCRFLTTLPTINWNGSVISTADTYRGQYMFNNCHKLNSIPSGYFANAVSELGYWEQTFQNCYNLMSIDSNLLSIMKPTRTSSVYQYTFYNCYSLQAINGFDVARSGYSISQNIFLNTFYNCRSLSSLTFNGGTANYTNQTINLSASSYIGYGGSPIDTATGLPIADNVSGGTTLADSVYNHDSAVATINSLPDTSAVSSPSNPSNKIMFAAGSGANTAGGDISNLTAAEIEVATNKGWSVEIS